MFGRLPAPDVRDGLFAVPRLLAAVAAPSRRYRYWNDTAATLDQGATSACVGYSWAHWLADGPTTQRVRPDPFELYRHAQRLDEWPGEDYDGSSVRGGAKALVERGAVTSYWWASTGEEVARAVLDVGPVVVGTEWLWSMMEPGPSGRLVVDVASGVAGGHAYLINGVNLASGTCRVKNSWGPSFGRNGRAVMRLDDLDVLVRGGGEACIAVEATLAAVATTA